MNNFYLTSDIKNAARPTSRICEVVSALILILCLGTAGLSGQTSSSLEMPNGKAIGYPLAAKAAGIEGTVRVKAILGEDGKIRDIRAVKGPKELRQAAIDAVSRYPYKPITDDAGNPSEVKLKVNVVYSLGNKKEKAIAQAAAHEELAKRSRDNAKISSPASIPNHKK